MGMIEWVGAKRGGSPPRTLAGGLVCLAAAMVLGGCAAKDRGGEAAAVAGAAAAATPDAGAHWPRIRSEVATDSRLEARVEELLGQLTLEHKVAQMVQADIRSVTPQDVKTYRLGSVLNGGGAWPGNDKHATVADWVELADQYYEASMDTTGGGVAIPVIWGVDAVHGHNNVIGATLFPHNSALGASHDPELIERIGAATAAEVAATGIDWTFAPTVAVVRDDRWGRSYEGYSEDPERVREYAARMVHGLQGVPGQSSFLDASRIVATAKHYIGDGGTLDGRDRGDNRSSEQELLAIHGQGYLSALQAGAQTVMASYNSWHGAKLHGQRYLLTDVLKTKLGFDGVVVSDWNGIDEVQACSVDRCPVAVNAGIDMVMVPEQWKVFLANTVAQVRSGIIPQARIDDAVRRILRVKLRAGLFEKGKPSTRPLAGKRALIGAAEHRALAREAVRKSLVLLKNDNKLLPLGAKSNVLVAGDGADNIGKQAGGWSITWQGSGNTNADFPGATSIFAGISAAVAQAGGKATLSVDGQYQSKPDVAIVVFGEEPYAEWHGDVPSLDYANVKQVLADEAMHLSPQPAPQTADQAPAAIPDAMQAASQRGSAAADLALLRRFKQAGIPVVAVFLTGRPLAVGAELEAADAFVVAWWPGTEGAGVADVLMRKADGSVNFAFSGKLSFSWPRTAAQTQLNRGDAGYDPLFAYGFGLTY